MGRQNLLPSDQRNLELLKCKAVAEAIDKLLKERVSIALLPQYPDAEVTAERTVRLQKLPSLQQDIAFALDEAIRTYIEGDAP